MLPVDTERFEHNEPILKQMFQRVKHLWENEFKDMGPQGSNGSRHFTHRWCYRLLREIFGVSFHKKWFAAERRTDGYDQELYNRLVKHNLLLTDQMGFINDLQREYGDVDEELLELWSQFRPWNDAIDFYTGEISQNILHEEEDGNVVAENSRRRRRVRKRLQREEIRVAAEALDDTQEADDRKVAKKESTYTPMQLEKADHIIEQLKQEGIHTPEELKELKQKILDNSNKNKSWTLVD